MALVIIAAGVLYALSARRKASGSEGVERGFATVWTNAGAQEAERSQHAHKASAEVIESIFFPNSPLHDGGVIINGKRITHAACIFPLTSRQEIRKTLGTRHRAAIGITEDSDALVIIVSEETGSVSYCHEGALHRDVGLDKLNELDKPTEVLNPTVKTKYEALKLVPIHQS